MMFVFEISVANNKDKKDKVRIDEVDFVRLLRLLKARNMHLYSIFNDFYDRVVEGEVRI
jgi:hypothetical protein